VREWVKQADIDQGRRSSTVETDPVVIIHPAQSKT